jgi:hypothetical protein
MPLPFVLFSSYLRLYSAGVNVSWRLILRDYKIARHNNDTNSNNNNKIINRIKLKKKSYIFAQVKKKRFKNLPLPNDLKISH